MEEEPIITIFVLGEEGVGEYVSQYMYDLCVCVCVNGMIHDNFMRGLRLRHAPPLPTPGVR